MGLWLHSNPSHPLSRSFEVKREPWELWPHIYVDLLGEDVFSVVMHSFQQHSRQKTNKLYHRERKLGEEVQLAAFEDN